MPKAKSAESENTKRRLPAEDHPILVKGFSPTQAQFVKEAAEKLGISRSDFIRGATRTRCANVRKGEGWPE